MPVTIALISLGCAKNQVDSETMLGMLKRRGYRFTPEPARADIVIINTCGFIEDAKKEAIEQIFDAVRLKEAGLVRGVIVTGCLSQRYRAEIAAEIPEVDAFLGTTSEIHSADAVEAVLRGETYAQFDGERDAPLFGSRILSTPPYTAYLKIAEGCDNRCSYCAIPLIRGPFRSTPIEPLVEQARTLADGGVRELCVVAQDTTRYGEDLYGERSLPALLAGLCGIEKLRWIRLLYCYPDKIDESLLQFMQYNDKIVKYLDIPIQHADADILRAMNRSGDPQSLLARIAHIRAVMPDAALRTTLITGFPGESEQQFETLCRFVKAARFERLGVFTYSAEEDTPAAAMDGQIDEDVKQRRRQILLDIQSGISAELLDEKRGRTLTVLVEGRGAVNGTYTGRTYMDAPEVDGQISFTAGRDLRAGEFVPVRVIGAQEYDLTGEMIE